MRRQVYAHVLVSNGCSEVIQERRWKVWKGCSEVSKEWRWKVWKGSTSSICWIGVRLRARFRRGQTLTSAALRCQRYSAAKSGGCCCGLTTVRSTRSSASKPAVLPTTAGPTAEGIAPSGIITTIPSAASVACAATTGCVPTVLSLLLLLLLLPPPPPLLAGGVGGEGTGGALPGGGTPLPDISRSIMPSMRLGI
jgi:hypothetical protein